ncbi:amidohydrolase [Allopusillimonas ginsengisoli]|uniref:amidohydrolase n=1 Tax=Allopusillimonas ginsengisoli TaxID=453575 RepID=UPI00101F3CB6|nr:amidohydrolase [Allopusillimonas ginsengisoli]TEA77308.1 amidohydrolase [Allopusillimonas ginsengisoli]
MLAYRPRLSQVLAVLLALSSVTVQASPDSIFINAKVYTADEVQPFAQAFAVEQGRIVAIGRQEEVLARKGAGTHVVDLEGKRVLPGLIDAHTHAVIAGLAAQSPNLNDTELDIETVRQRAQAWLKADQYGAERPLVVFGVNPSTLDNPQALSEAFDTDVWASQPLLLMGSDLHTGWANRAMRAKASIDARYVQDLAKHLRHAIGVGSDGEPNGILIDAGIDQVTLQLPKPDTRTLLEAGRFAVQTYNRYGVTAWMDAAANAGPGEALFSRRARSTGTGILPAYRELAQAGALTAHVAALLVASPQSDTADLDDLASVREQFLGIPNLTLPGIKIFADGVLEYPAQSAALLGKYRNSGKQGALLLQTEGWRALVDAADARGLLVHIHALGDRAVQESLDAFEVARTKRESGIRHSITHLQLVDDRDYPRFERLGVIAVMQLHWAELDNYLLDLVKPYISEAEFMRQYPAKSLQDHGAVIAGASDWPISTPNPWEAMHRAMTRQGPGGGLNAAERMDRADMLLAYTRHAAQAIGLESQIGSLVEGKLADFIVVDRDVLDVDVESLKDTQVLATYFAGRKVYGVR